MKHFILAVCLCLPLPALAEEEGDFEEGFSLMEEGAKLLFRGFMNEVEPTLDEFSDLAGELEPALEMLASEMGPALLEMIQTLDSVRYYDTPEVLPNGDIIIRRKPDAPDFTPREPDGAVIDL
ncbi:hypothetical protein Q4555_11295 [Octadecabacter sp. 1_MG-2023]|uniref:hypothetical protein n=1 Tax=unclassified Octadecabacter TaxID=196158 RepID=UPI001C081068|nr:MULTISPECIES: hypothetical protein [unclassified Octadecabacter]MBU2993900.1 hypothetical protein [Octadecabacter sp. B2R22]MDO6735254.1 hypothetical protein [Octadecabacter sp. 1_MG-2023]